jgi:hypothetical protein
MAIQYNLWPFGIVCGHLVHSYHFGMFEPRKIWQLWINRIAAVERFKKEKNV